VLSSAVYKAVVFFQNRKDLNRPIRKRDEKQYLGFLRSLEKYGKSFIFFQSGKVWENFVLVSWYGKKEIIFIVLIFFFIFLIRLIILLSSC